MVNRIGFVFVLTVLAYSHLGYAQKARWKPTQGPFGGYIRCFAAGDHYLYAGTDDTEGIYRSSDYGRTWGWTGHQLPVPWITQLAARDTIVIAASSIPGLFRSSNEGNTWSGMKAFNGKTVTSIAANSKLLFVAADTGLYQSTDDGISWQLVIGSQQNINSISINDSVVVAASYPGIWVSKDGGKNWQFSMIKFYGHGSEIIEHPHSVAVSGTVILASTDSIIFRSMDMGATWNSIGKGHFQDFAVNGQTFFATDFFTFFRSADSGTSWSVPPPLTFATVTSIGLTDSGLIIGIADHGTSRSTDDGIQWNTLSTGIGNTNVISLKQLGNKTFAATDHGVYISTNSGSEWVLSDLGTRILSMVESQGTLFAARDDAIFYSQNSGADWTQGYFPQPFGSLIDPQVLCVKDSIVLAGGFEMGLIQSSDFGQTWNSITNYGAGFPVTSIVFCKGVFLTAGNNSANSYRSSDHGATWQHIPDALSVSCLYSMESDSESIFASTDLGIYQSTNFGQSWVKTKCNDTTWALYTIRNLIFAESTNGPIHSSDKGASWILDSTGIGRPEQINFEKRFAGPYIYSFLFADNTLYAGTDGMGVFKTAFPFNAVISTDPLKSSVFNLYPNPASDKLTLTNSLTLTGSSELFIFDALGRIVTQPLIPAAEASGPHEITIDTRNFPPGVYTARLTAPGQEQVARFVKE
jgi:hypothetical protein